MFGRLDKLSRMTATEPRTSGVAGESATSTKQVPFGVAIPSRRSWAHQGFGAWPSVPCEFSRALSGQYSSSEDRGKLARLMEP